MRRLFTDLVPGSIATLPRHRFDPRPNRGIFLDSNEAAGVVPPVVIDDLRKVLADISVHRYPDCDCSALRRVVARILEVDEGRLSFGNGSEDIVWRLCATFGRPRPGADRATILYPTPTFPGYRMAALASGDEPVEVPLTATFDLDNDVIRAAITASRPNLIFFARPNNPTGNLWQRAAIEAVARDNTDLLVIIDEAYEPFAQDSCLDLARQLPNVAVLRTLSKVGLAALRVGYLYASAEVIEILEKVRPPFNVGAWNQHAAAWLLEHHAETLADGCRGVVLERERVLAELAMFHEVTAYESRGNFLLVRVPEAASVVAALAERGIFVRRSPPQGPTASCIRVTIGVAGDNDAFLAALRAILAGR